MHIFIDGSGKTVVAQLGNTARIRSAIAAYRHTSRGGNHAWPHARHFWISDMDQSPVERFVSTAKLEAPLPQEFPAAFQRLVDARNRSAEGRQKRIYARNLYEEALGELIHLANNGRVTFIASPFRNFTRKMFWVDQAVKSGVERLALTHGITRSAVVMTAFQQYLDRHGALPDPPSLIDVIGP